jgi:Lysyl oxidase
VSGRRWLLAVLGLAAVAAAVVTAIPSDGKSGTTEARQLLPDLEIAAPRRLVVIAAGSDGTAPFRLSFESATSNVGTGPLVITGERSSADEAEMTASQVIHLADGSTTAVADVGLLTYVKDPTHEHWHLLPFMRYELRTAEGFRLVAPDGKTGFCLGDRYNADPKTRTSREPAAPVFDTNCGPGETGLLTIEEGISPGWGDNYETWRDAQYIDVTDVPPGRYLLVHRVNRTRSLREASYENNSSSLLLRLSWPDGPDRKPRIQVLARCPDSPRCGQSG